MSIASDAAIAVKSIDQQINALGMQALHMRQQAAQLNDQAKECDDLVASLRAVLTQVRPA